MRLVRISSEEQPTQELNLNSQTASVRKQSAQLVEIASQKTERQSRVSVAVEQHGQEQQPAYEADLEQQATLPMAFERLEIEQPSLEESKVVEQKMHEQAALLPGERQQGRRSYTSLLWWVPLLMFILFFVSILSEHSAMLRKDWTSMWSMLSPDAQRQWQGEKDFIHFEQTKFGSLQLTSFINSSAQKQETWLDPDTTQVYPGVEVLHISLEASAPQGLLSAPSNLALTKGLFNNTLFALVYYQFNWRVLLAGPADPDAPMLVPASPPTKKLLVPIFMYHHVSNLSVSNYLDYGLTVTTTNFNAQLDCLQQQGYHSINQTELFDALYYGKALPTHPMIFTFDDGYKDVYTDALPALLAHHYRGVFYIITGMIGGNYMTWNQVRTLAQDGMQISSHTINHVNVGQPPPWTSTQRELLVSKKTLEIQLGQPIQFFCYPTGEPFHNDSVYEQQLVLADLYKDGYVAATLDPFSSDSAIQNAETPYQLPRIRVSGGESMQLFTSILNSTLNIDAYRMANGFPY